MKRDPDKRAATIMLRRCHPCRGTGIGRFARHAPVTCVHCFGYGQVLVTERTRSLKVRA